MSNPRLKDDYIIKIAKYLVDNKGRGRYNLIGSSTKDLDTVKDAVRMLGLENEFEKIDSELTSEINAEIVNYQGPGEKI